ncbi:DUF1667 domain-containing protein [Enterococcus pseudoavium]|uniref:DUF1667 domain-containing protein n=1 Tax=Enterococcus pseudoavium TaxID=44007 RepID=A0AAE4I217_9ENTE|nr:DUF1667 domain-containing protein [Enterococcus pseudoavium]MDT2736677.1 DUF1667 domain-containing protein [Enterococcus pseudoavium]MDT2753680.1 DUF1667 domain-containing protein [Enterococcus pseudoavium]MDT2771263.1 DUF1667 domain-containing protein [Enterococcus pseudoavium]REC31660.1 DUF1667 domain-containing protein [Enterococcus pseudoavium]
MKQFICIMCPKGCHLTVDEDHDYLVSGNSCNKGVKYGQAEATNPVRVVTSTVSVKGGNARVCSVKTADAIPKDSVLKVMEEINQVKLQAPVNIGDIAIKNLLNTGVDVVVTSEIAAS